MKTVVGAVPLVAVLATGQPSRAQEATGSLLGTYYDAYLRLNAHEWALDLLVSIESEISPGCSLSELLPHSVGPVLPLDVDPATGQIVGGAWAMSYSAEVCGQDVRRSALLMVDNGTGRALALAPGHSRADPILQYDMNQHSTQLVSVIAAGRGCTTRPILIDTRILSEEEGAWTERWDWRACGEVIPLNVRFSDNPTTGGTQFAISPG